MAVFLYDGHCVLCSKAVEYTLRHEKNPQTRFVAILSEEGRALAKDYDINPENPQSFLFIKDALAHASSDGVLELVHHVGGPARILCVGKFLPKKWRDGLYYLIARNRYKIFGRTNQCFVPPQNMTDRFVLT